MGLDAKEGGSVVSLVPAGRRPVAADDVFGRSVGATKDGVDL